MCDNRLSFDYRNKTAFRIKDQHLTSIGNLFQKRVRLNGNLNFPFFCIFILKINLIKYSIVSKTEEYDSENLFRPMKRIIKKIFIQFDPLKRKAEASSSTKFLDLIDSLFYVLIFRWFFAWEWKDNRGSAP